MIGRATTLAAVLAVGACGGGGSATRRPVGNRPAVAASAIEREVRPPVATDLARYLLAAKLGGPRDGTLVATIELDSTGPIRCVLFERDAPMTVANFVGLVTGFKAWRDPASRAVMSGVPFYDRLTFHRVIPGFMIQGGDPLGLGTGGPGYVFADENLGAHFDRAGVLAMANAGPATNGSQFFITDRPVAALDGKYSVFGQCYDPWVVGDVASVAVDSRSRPIAPVRITAVRIGRDREPPALRE